MKKNTLQFIREMLPVFTGILIALFVNNWNEERKNEEYLDKIYINIKKELTETHKEILKKEKLQKKLLDTLNNYLNNKNTLFEVLTKGDGIYLPNIRMNSWKAISNSKLELLDYKKLIDLSNIEEGKELFKLKSNMLANFTYSNMNSHEKEKKEVFKILLKDVTSTQKGLKMRIEKIIDE